ncbi:hypothetical protein H0H93_009658, partial [Arthromyces matolae]
AGHWAGTDFEIPRSPFPILMKTSIIQVLLLFLFALAASSIPVLVPRLPAPSDLKISEDGHERTYTIDGKTYDKKQVEQSVKLFGEALDGQSHPSPQALSEAQKLAIVGFYLDYVNDKRTYGGKRLELHDMMNGLVNLLLQGKKEPIDPYVKSVASESLEVYLGWEKDNHYGNLYPKADGRGLDDEKYLEELKTSLTRIIYGRTR